MNEEEYVSDLGRKLEYGIILARKRMLHEKALRNQDVIITDSNDRIIRVPAKDIIAARKEFQRRVEIDCFR